VGFGWGLCFLVWFVVGGGVGGVFWGFGVVDGVGGGCCFYLGFWLGGGGVVGWGVCCFLLVFLWGGVGWGGWWVFFKVKEQLESVGGSGLK